MSIVIRTGNVLDSGCDALVNTVNCVGVMGKGVALAFATRFPEILGPYRAACRSGALAIGKVQVLPVKTGQLVVNFPTKIHWRNPSEIEWIPPTLDALLAEIAARKIATIGVPALGCGNGGLDWANVEPLVRAKIGGLIGVEVHLYPPQRR